MNGNHDFKMVTFLNVNGRHDSTNKEGEKQLMIRKYEKLDEVTST